MGTIGTESGSERWSEKQGDGGAKKESAQSNSRLEQVKSRLAPVDKWVRQVATDKPMVAIGCAVGLGYIVGRIFRR
jgi:hypothetical protein